MDEYLARVVAEVADLQDGSPHAPLAVAIALEDALGITLDDSDITSEALGSAAAVRATVSRHLAGP